MLRRVVLKVIVLIALSVATDRCSASTYAFTGFWRELGGVENGVLPSGEGGRHSIYVHLWDVLGFPLSAREIYAREIHANTNVLLGVTDTNGFLEVAMTATNAFRLSGHGGGLGGTIVGGAPIFDQNRAPIHGQYSWEFGFMGSFGSEILSNPFNTNYDGVLNSSGIDVCEDLSAPATHSIIYRSLSTNYCSPAPEFGPLAAVHGQTFVAPGNRVVAARVGCIGPQGEPAVYTVQFFESGPGGPAIGPPRTSWIPDGKPPQSVLLKWGMHQVRTIPGQRYYMHVTSESGLFAVGGVTNAHATGEYLRDDQPVAPLDIDGMIVGGHYPSGSIMVELRDPNGNALTGATVRTALRPDEFEAIEYDNGRYLLQSLPRLSTLRYRIGITNVGFVPAVLTNVAVTLDVTNTLRIVLQPNREYGGVLAAQVIDPTGAQVKGVQIRAHPFEHQMVTGLDGYAESSPLVPGTYSLIFWKPGFGTVALTNVVATSGTTNRLNVTMRREFLLNGNFEEGETHWFRFRLLTNSIETIRPLPTRLSGQNALGWQRTNSIYDRAFYQQVSVLPGYEYTFAAWTWRSDPFADDQPNMESWVGIEPFGTTNALSPNVIWSAPEHSHQTWTRQVVMATAQSNVITVFIRSRANRVGNPMQTVADDATLDGPAPYPLGLTAYPGDQTVRLQWYPTLHASSYNVKRGEPGRVTIFRGIATNHFVDTSVSNTVAYAYSVSQLIGQSESVYCPPVVVVPEAAEILLPAGSLWKYLDDGSDQGTAWRRTNFNDTAWNAGFARLGFGGDGEITLLNSGAHLSQPTRRFYFRHEFFVTNNLRIYTNLGVRLTRDDGAIIYLNGQEIMRSNFPELTPVSGTNESRLFTSAQLTNVLMPGRNVLAAEVFQATSDTNDLGFDLELVGYVLERPRLSIRWENDRAYLTWRLAYASATVEAAPILDSPSWGPVSEAPEQQGDEFRLQVQLSGQRFFRLRYSRD